MIDDVTVRPALPSDRDAIVAFTNDTFDWGDYIADVIDSWMDRDDMVVMVAVVDGEPIATGTARMLSPTEAWFLGARVRSDYRGRGIAARLSASLREWAREQGATVGRLLIDEGNASSIRHVEKTGRRHVASMVRAEKAVGDASPSPDGNGGRRVPSKLRARPANSAEAQAAFASWSVGELGRASRGMFGIGWSFRRLTIADLEAAARGNAFWEIGAGWALASAGPEAGFEVGWIETREEDVDDLLRSLIDLAIGSGSESIVLWIPDVDWAVRAARRLGFETSSEHIYASAL
jgi:GNAT superfamily N-acetyltransferase